MNTAQNNKRDANTATHRVTVIDAKDIAAGTKFSYGSHDYIASTVNTVNGITKVAVEGNIYPMEFYPNSRVFAR